MLLAQFIISRMFILVYVLLQDLCSFLNPEMRGGVLYTKCDCLIRNGLQDDCPLTLCQGQPDCLIKPWPLCPPGKYYRRRHPEIYPSPGN